MNGSNSEWSGPECELLTFATRWARYGGGPADHIRDRFGIDETEFFARILDATDQSGPYHNIEDHDIEGHDIAELRRVARRRLWLQRA